MKIRTGFVSNSSSSSFVVRKKYVSEDTLERIRNHIDEGAKLNIEWAKKEDEWQIQEDDNYLRGSTFMDNFSMWDFFQAIELDPRQVKWEGDFVIYEGEKKIPITIKDSRFLLKLLNEVDQRDLNVEDLFGLKKIIEEIGVELI